MKSGRVWEYPCPLALPPLRTTGVGLARPRSRLLRLVSLLVRGDLPHFSPSPSARVAGGQIFILFSNTIIEPRGIHMVH